MSSIALGTIIGAAAGNDLYVTGNLIANVNSSTYLLSDTGAVTRTIVSKEEEMVSLKDFGAVGDGITDDTTAVQNALNTGKYVTGEQSKTYLVSNVTMQGGCILDLKGGVITPKSGSNWAIQMYNYQAVIKNGKFNDPNNNIVRQTTISTNALTSATVIAVTSATGMMNNMVVVIRLNNGRTHTSYITNISGTNITIKDALPSNANSGNSFSACFGQLVIGDGSTTGYYDRVENVDFANCSLGIYVRGDTEKMFIDNVSFSSVQYGCIFVKDTGNDCMYSNISAFCGYNQTNNYTGNGVTTTYNLTTAAVFTSNLQVSVNNVTTSAWTLNSGGTSITFSVAPGNGLAIKIINQVPSAFGIVLDLTNWATPFAGSFDNISILGCDYCLKTFYAGGIFNNLVIDTCDKGIYMSGAGTSIPIVFNNMLCGYFATNGVILTNGVIQACLAGFFSTLAAPTLYLPSGASLGTDLTVGSGCTIYINRTNWFLRDGDSNISNSGTIVYESNSILAQNGTVSLPSYSFASDTSTGIYRIGSGDIGIATAGAKRVDISSTAVALTPPLTLVGSTVVSYNISANSATTAEMDFYPITSASEADYVFWQNSGGADNRIWVMNSGSVGSFSTNSSFVNMGFDGTQNSISSGNFGSGTIYQLKLQVGANSNQMILTTGGQVSMSSTTASSSNTTGGLQLAGGIGISNTTNSSSNTNGGTLTTAGGVAIAKDTWMGGNLFMNSQFASIDMGIWTAGGGNPSINFITANTGSSSTPTCRIQAYGGSTTNTGTIEFDAGAVAFNSTAALSSALTTASTSNTTGAFTLAGGIGISNATDASSATNGGTLTTAGGVAIAKSLWVGTTVNATGTTASTSNTTGTILTAGGIGISNATNSSSSTNGGTFTTAGGAAIAKDVYIGGNLSITGSISKGSGSFLIPHPDPVKADKGYKLKHCFVESNTRGDNLYRYTVQTKGCKAVIDLPDYYKFLNENTQVFISAKNVLGFGMGDIDELLEKIHIEVSTDGIYNVLVIGTRKDQIAINFFDNQGGVEFIENQDTIPEEMAEEIFEKYC